MVLKIADIASIFTGHQSRKAIEDEPLGTHHLLQIRDFDRDRTRLNLEGMIRFSPASLSGDKPLRKSDVVFLSRGQKNFAFALPEMPSPTLASAYFFILRPKEGVSGAYLAWYLNQPMAQQHFKRLATTGAHMPVVTRDVIESLKVPRPDLPTQERIVALDALAQRQSQLLSELADKKRAMVNALCRRAANL